MRRYDDYEYIRREYNNNRAKAIRTRHVHIQKIMIAIGIFITILICTLFSIKAFAYAGENEVDICGSKQYKSIVIYCGDSIESVAEEYICGPYSSIDTYKHEIMSINHLSSDSKLIAGNYLVIPYYVNK